MADMYAVSGETLTGIANAIRGKTGSDDFMTVASMASAIEGIPSGGGSEAPHYAFRWDTYEDFMNSITETDFEFRYPEDVVSFLSNYMGYLCMTISFVDSRSGATYSTGCVVSPRDIEDYNIYIGDYWFHTEPYTPLVIDAPLIVSSDWIYNFVDIVDLSTGEYIHPIEIVDFTITLTCFL